MHLFPIRRSKEPSMMTRKFTDRIIWQTRAKNHLSRASFSDVIQISVKIMKLHSQASIYTAHLNAKVEFNSYMSSSR